MKAPLIMSKQEVWINVIQDKLEFQNLQTNGVIGRVSKNRIVEPEKWNDLIENIDVNN